MADTDPVSDTHDNLAMFTPGQDLSPASSANEQQEIHTALAALLESNRLMQEKLAQPGKTKKVYVRMLEEFNGKVGDFIPDWLEKLETWFRHRAMVEGPVEPREQIETAIQRTKTDVSLNLVRHEKDYGEWETRDAFATHMKETYGSPESEYTRFIQLRVMTQGQNKSVNPYYAHFRCILGRQKRRMRVPEDNYIHYFMFVAGLQDVINKEVLRLPGSSRIGDVEFHEVLELAKRSEHMVKIQNGTMDSKKRFNQSHESGHGKKARTSRPWDAGVSNNSDKGSHTGSHSKISRERLTPREKDFLTSNIKRGGGLIVYERVRNKLEWIACAKKAGVCMKCCARGHRSTECTMEDNTRAENARLNAMVKNTQDSIDSGMDRDVEYLCSIQDRKDLLMTYYCKVNGRKGTVLLDTGASENYISQQFAQEANLRYKDMGITRTV